MMKVLELYAWKRTEEKRSQVVRRNLRCKVLSIQRGEVMRYTFSTTYPETYRPK